jgi:hypothetical protein
VSVLRNDAWVDDTGRAGEPVVRGSQRFLRRRDYPGGLVLNVGGDPDFVSDHADTFGYGAGGLAGRRFIRVPFSY